MTQLRRVGSALILCAATACLLTVGASRASADSETITLSVPNTALSCCTGPYATVTVNQTSTTTATITFTSLDNGGYQYLMGDGSTADLNVNGTFNASFTPTESNSISGFTPTFKDITSGQVDGFGNFNLVIDNKDGFTDTATSVTFTLTATGTTTWANAAAVLTTNGNNADAAIHGFACADPCTINSSAFATGYAANAGAVSTPEPVSMVLMGTFLLGAAMLLGRKLRAFES